MTIAARSLPLRNFTGCQTQRRSARQRSRDIEHKSFSDSAHGTLLQGSVELSIGTNARPPGATLVPAQCCLAATSLGYIGARGKSKVSVASFCVVRSGSHMRNRISYFHIWRGLRGEGRGQAKENTGHCDYERKHRAISRLTLRGFIGSCRFCLFFVLFYFLALDEQLNDDASDVFFAENAG